MKVGESATAKTVRDNGVVVQRPDGSETTIGRRQRGGFDVAEERPLQVAAGDELLFRANCPDIGVSNGERLRVEAVDAATNTVTLAGGKVLPDNFTQVSHGHAVTSHKSQGASVEQSILVVGPSSLPASNLRQFYVSNTRFKDGHRLYAHDLNALKGAVAIRSERMLAREFVAGLGKELTGLLARSQEAKASKKPPSASEAAEIRQRAVRIQQLLRDVARHERRAKTAASFHAFWSQLGGRLLPKRIQQWMQAKRSKRTRQQRARSAKTYALARSIRKAHRVGQWMRRAGTKARSAGRRL